MTKNVAAAYTEAECSLALGVCAPLAPRRIGAINTPKTRVFLDKFACKRQS